MERPENQSENCLDSFELGKFPLATKIRGLYQSLTEHLTAPQKGELLSGFAIASAGAVIFSVGIMIDYVVVRWLYDVGFTPQSLISSIILGSIGTSMAIGGSRVVNLGNDEVKR